MVFPFLFKIYTKMNYQYDSYKNLIKEWSCAKECADLYSISRGNISMFCKHNSTNPKNFKKLQGFIFSFNPISK